MTLNDILVSALAQLDRGHDAQTLDTYRERLTRFANDAQSDLAYSVGLFRTDWRFPSGGVLDLSMLPRKCRKVIRVEQLGHPVPFRTGETTNTILLPYDERAKITYRYEPMPLVNPNDTSELNESIHGLMVSYIVGRERMSGDVSTQSGSNLYLAMYEAAKSRLRMNMGETDAYTLKNRY